MACAPPMTLKSRVPLRTERHQQNAAPVERDPELDEAERCEGKEEVRREGCSDLDEWLRQAGESWTQADGDTDGRPDQSAEDDQHEHSRGCGASEDRGVCDLSSANAAQDEVNRGDQENECN